MHTTQAINIGEEQIVRIPEELRIAAPEAPSGRDAVTGDVVLSTHGTQNLWAAFLPCATGRECPRISWLCGH